MLFVCLAMCETEEEKTKFEKIYKEYKKHMFYTAYKILRNKHDAEDAVSKAFLVIVKNLKNISEVRCHKTMGYVVIIVENIAIDMYRKEKRHGTTPIDDVEYRLVDGTSTEQLVESMVTRNVLSLLPSSYREVLMLKYMNGYKNAEIAEMLNITEENLRHRMMRAKNKLAKILEKEGAYNK